MTSRSRFEQELPDLLADLLIEPIPYYRDSVVQQTAQMRQRPAWTLPERWIPMSVITLGRMTGRTVPWRTVGLLALLAALLAVGLAAYVGSRPRVPAPFGLAANGSFAYATSAGDIYAGDPVTGKSVAIASGPEIDSSPMYSPDGRQLAFLRQLSTGGYDLVVTAADGKNAHAITDVPVLEADMWGIQWTPDSGGIVVNSFTNDDVRLYDASGKTAPRILATNAHVDPGAFRPPLGDELVFIRDSTDGSTLFVADADGSNPRQLLHVASGDLAGDGLRPSWSPDGTRLAFLKLRGGDGNQARINIMAADGTGSARELTNEPGLVYENHIKWSPDGTRIAFQRWDNSSGQPRTMPLGIQPLDGGSLVDAGPELGAYGTEFGWSPDGSILWEIPGEPGSHHVLIDPQRGTWKDLIFPDPGGGSSWQRLAR